MTHTVSELSADSPQLISAIQRAIKRENKEEMIKFQNQFIFLFLSFGKMIFLSFLFEINYLIFLLAGTKQGDIDREKYGAYNVDMNNIFNFYYNFEKCCGN